MPGTDRSPDGLDDMLAELDSQDAPDNGAEQAGRDATHAALQPTGDVGEGGKSNKDRLYANKYKSPEEMEKAHLGLRKGYDEKAGRVKSLEQILSNPKLHALAKNDPEVRDALAKAGITLAEKEEVEDDGSEYVSEEETKEWLESPDGREAQREAKFNLYMERLQFQDNLGRKLKPEEWKELTDIIREAPRLSMSRAWKLTSAYERQLKESEEKRIAEATRRNGGKRPAPRAPFMQGQNKDGSRQATELRSDKDKAAFIQDILERNQ